MPNLIITNDHGSFSEVVLNRPEARNALSLELLDALTGALKAVFSKSACRAVLISSSSAASFCSGADLKWFAANRTIESRREFFRRLVTVIELMRSAPLPIVAAVQGGTFAGGCALLAASDFVIAGRAASFALPEVRVGMVPMVVMAALYQSMNRRVLRELVLSARSIDAAEALRAGLVSRTVADEQVAAEARSLCESFAALAPGALAETKRALNDLTGSTPIDLNAYAERIAQFSLGNETAEGCAAFIEKRSASWK